MTSFCFLIYERLVTKRENTKNAALQVVASLFPSGVQDRVLKGVQDGLNGTSKQGNVIASFFPATTILFGTFALFCFLFVSFERRVNILIEDHYYYYFAVLHTFFSRSCLFATTVHYSRYRWLHGLVEYT